jgi:hypothetical protein
MKNTWLLILIGVLLVMTFYKAGKALITTFADAIKTYEGWHEGSISYRNNNPGNLKDRNFEGTVGFDSYGHAIFDTYEHGWNALVKKLTNAITGLSSVYLPSMSLIEFFDKWTYEVDPVKDDALALRYAEFVANELGVTASSTLAEIFV